MIPSEHERLTLSTEGHRAEHLTISRTRNAQLVSNSLPPHRATRQRPSRSTHDLDIRLFLWDRHLGSFNFVKSVG